MATGTEDAASVVVGKDVLFAGGRVKKRINFVPLRFKPDIWDLCLTRAGCKKSLDAVATHSRAHEPVLFRSELTVNALGMNDKELHLRAPDGLGHFTLLALAEAIVAAFQDLYENPTVLEEFKKQYRDVEDSEDVLSRMDVSALIYDPEVNEFSLAGCFSLQRRRIFAPRPVTPQQPGDLIRFKTHPEPKAEADEAPKDDDDDYSEPDEDWPYVGLEQAWLEAHLERVEGLDDVVIPGKASIPVVFNRGFIQPQTFTLTAPAGEQGFTRRQLILAIAAQYQLVYAEEAATTTLPVESMGDRARATASGSGAHLTNRAETNGKWGLTGHALGDLVLYEVKFDENAGVFRMGIDT